MTQHDKNQVAVNFRHEIEGICKKYGAFFKYAEEHNPDLSFVVFDSIRLKLDRKEAIVR